MRKFDPLSDVSRNLKIIVAASIFLAIVLIVNALASIYLLRKNSVQDRSDQLSNLTMVLAEHTGQIIFSANTALTSIHNLIELSKIEDEKAYQNFASKKSQFEFLSNQTKSNPILDVATFVASDGKVLNFSRSYPAPDIDLSNRDYFKYLSNHVEPSIFYSTPVKNKGNGKWVFYLAQRVSGKNNQFLGVVLVGVSVEVFSSLYERIGGGLGDGAAITLYREDKTLLTRWPFADDLIGMVNTNNLIEASLANVDVNGGVIFTSTTGFTRLNTAPLQRMISYRKVKSYPFVVGASVPETIYLENWYKNSTGVVLSTALSLIALFVFAYFLYYTYRRNAENQFLANHDLLTELPNRALFLDRLRQGIALSKRKRSKLAILFIDLDNLKQINDLYGHYAGDVTLKEVARRLKAAVRDSDTVARLGGDEFVVLLMDVDSEVYATAIAENIRIVIMAPIEFDALSLSTSASIGVALYPLHGETEVEIMNCADVAMYAAKEGGRNTIKFSDSPI